MSSTGDGGAARDLERGGGAPLDSGVAFKRDMFALHFSYSVTSPVHFRHSLMAALSPCSGRQRLPAAAHRGREGVVDSSAFATGDAGVARDIERGGGTTTFQTS